MKLKNSPLVAFTCGALLGSATLSQATLIVAEDFTYADGALNGQNGGTGFSTAWTSGPNVVGGVASGTSDATRDLAAPFPALGTIWLSFDWGNNAQQTGNAYGGLTLFDGGTERHLIGNTYSSFTWGMNSGSSSVQTTELNYPGLKTGVAKITLGAGATSTVELWVGPTGSPVDVSGPAMATATGRNLAGVNRIRINGADLSNGNHLQSFDNLLIGNTMADVDAIDPPPVVPISGTWTNLAGGQWNTAGNWLGSVIAIGSSSTADFNTLDVTADTTVDLDSARTIGNLVFGDTDTSSAAAWTLTGNTLTLAGPTPTITVNALGSTKDVTISTAIAGTQGLTKSGPGTLIITGANNYSGTTAISEGTLKLEGTGGGFYSEISATRDYSISLGTVLNLHGASVPNGTANISGAGTLRISGNGLAASADGRDVNIFLEAGGVIDIQSGSSIYNGGWLAFQWASNQATLNVDGQVNIADGAPLTADALTGNGTIGSSQFGGSTTILTLGIAGGSGTFSGNIVQGLDGGTRTISLTKIGSGTQTLSGTNTYDGNTTVNDGGLTIAPAGSLRFRPTTIGVTNSLSGSATATLSYLGTLDLDLSAAAVANGNLWTIVDVSSFSGQAPTLTPAAVTSTLGSFNETTPGTWELAVTGAKWTFAEAAGTLSYTATGTDYDTWGTPYGLATGSEGGDLDNDGVTNFEEYAFGLIPNSGTSVNPITTQLDKTTGTSSYTRRDPSLLNPVLTYSIWYSIDLATWSEDTGAVEGAATLNGQVETVPVTVSPGLLTNPKLFIQVRGN